MEKVSLHPPAILHSARLPSILLFMAQKSNETTWDVNPRKSRDINYLSLKLLCHRISLHHQPFPCFIFWCPVVACSPHILRGWSLSRVPWNADWLLHCIPMSWVNFGVQKSLQPQVLVLTPKQTLQTTSQLPFWKANRSPTNGTNLKMIVLFPKWHMLVPLEGR